MFNPNSTKSPSYTFPTHTVSIPALFFIPEKDFLLNKKNTFSSSTPVLRKGTSILVHSYGIGQDSKWARVSLEDGSVGFVVYRDTLSPQPLIAKFHSASPKQEYQSNRYATETNWKTQTPNLAYDDPYLGSYVIHVEMQNVIDFNGGKEALKGHLERARAFGTKEILKQVGYKNYLEDLNGLLYSSYLFSVAEEWHIDPRPCSTLRVAVSIPKRFLFSEEEKIDQPPLEDAATGEELPDINIAPIIPAATVDKAEQPLSLRAESMVDLKNCVIDTRTRIRDLASIKTPLEINKWIAINQQYERNRVKIESDIFTRSLVNLDEIQDRSIRILLGRDPLRGRTDKQKLDIYVSMAMSLDWAKFLGVAAQCLSRPIPLDELAALMEKYKEARKFIDGVLSSTLCNPYLKTGLKIINGFELPIIRAYNPNEILAREIESAFVKIMHDLVSFGIRKSLEAAAKACATDPTANFNANGPALNPLNLEDAEQDPSIADFLDQITALSGPSPTEEDKANTKRQISQMIDDISSCLSYKELCSLYRGRTINDEVYQLILSVIKRKYSQFVSLFSTREQVIRFFATIGNRLDLSLCSDASEPDMPVFSKDGTNLLCDDGTLKDLREKILADKGLTPELIDELLAAKNKEEVKALEDVLKLLNSDNPFDFSQVPDLGCRVFPSGETIAPSMQSFTAMLNSMIRSIYDSFDAEAAEWYKTTYSAVDPNKSKILKFNETTGEVEIEKNITISDQQKNSIKANSGKVDPAKQETDSTLPSGIDEIKYPSFIFKKSLEGAQLVKRNSIDDKERLTFSVSLNGDLQQRMDLDFIQTNLKQGIQLGEQTLSQLGRRIWSQILGIYGAELTRLAGIAAINANRGLPALPAPFVLRPMIGFLSAVDTFLRSNIPDSEELKETLKDAHLVLGLDETQQANGFFAAENGAAIYLAICEQIKQPQTNAFIVGLGIPQAEIDAVISQYEAVKDYYRAIIRLKINYPDYDITRVYGVDTITTSNGQVVPSYYDGVLYDIQRLEVARNKKSFIKITEVSKVPEAVQRFLSRTYNADIGLSWAEKSKEDIFTDYLKNKFDTYGFSEDGVVLDTQKNFGTAYEEVTQRIYNKTLNSILNKSNKFAYLKDTSSTYFTVLQATGSGQPYTQYLKLVLPQTPEQKLCGVRPHYLDIDAIKDNVIQEKANNICVEKVLDTRTVGNDPVSSADMHDIETSSTQDALLRGMYRLAVRMFLHDILLRGIVIFGYYDPQSLRDEPMFVSFMTRMVESEMRGMDNTFYNMLTSFLYKGEEEGVNANLRKTQLFRSLVEDELKYVVLPKLAKRITADTNEALIKNKPKDNPIILQNILDEVANYNLFEVKNRAIYFLLNLDYQPNGTPTRREFKVYQKIYENPRAGSDDQVLREFIASDEYQFLFKYLFPATQILNDLFVTSCLSTTTRKQVVNSFKGTKRDIITTAKIIQTNGQPVARDPNNSQELVDDPMQLVAGFILQMAFKTPINVLKGIAESTEPNIALTSMAFKIARAFVPELPSVIIPAVSIPLGTLPTPITCPLPFINPILAIAYFATLAWYDDKPPEEMINGAVKALESTIMKPKIVCGDDVVNQDLFYKDKKTKIGSEYNVKVDALGGTVQELSSQQLSLVRAEEQQTKVIQKILNKIKDELSITNDTLDSRYIQIITGIVTDIETTNGVRLTVDSNTMWMANLYNGALARSRTAIQSDIIAASPT
jgi:hypothetical protein